MVLLVLDSYYTKLIAIFQLLSIIQSKYGYKYLYIRKAITITCFTMAVLLRVTLYFDSFVLLLLNNTDQSRISLIYILIISGIKSLRRSLDCVASVVGILYYRTDSYGRQSLTTLFSFFIKHTVAAANINAAITSVCQR